MSLRLSSFQPQFAILSGLDGLSQLGSQRVWLYPSTYSNYSHHVEGWVQPTGFLHPIVSASLTDHWIIRSFATPSFRSADHLLDCQPDQLHDQLGRLLDHLRVWCLLKLRRIGSAGCTNGAEVRTGGKKNDSHPPCRVLGRYGHSRPARVPRRRSAVILPITHSL